MMKWLDAKRQIYDEELHAMNNVAGVDVSKGKSMVTVLRPFGEVVAKPFSVGHTGSELKELADYLKSLDGETRVVMEHTGRYYEPVARFLHEEGIFVSAVNPKLIKDYGNNTLRKVKTDKADARKIARYGLDNWRNCATYTYGHNSYSTENTEPAARSVHQDKRR